MSSINDIVRKLRENRILNEREDYNSKSVDELIKLAQGGDQLATETLINSHKNFIKKMSSKYFLDSGDKEDVEQIATIAFWDAINSYNPDKNGDFEAFAGMIIKRKLTDAIRSDDAEKSKINTLANSIDATVSDDEGGELSIGDTLPSKEASPEEQYLGRAGAKELMEFMRDKFSQAERDVIMRYIRGYKVSEIAEETGMKYKSVENALMRVKNKLTDYLRTRESKKIRENKSVEFSDEEKQILESVITKVNKHEHLRESTVSKLKESYENYTESQLDDELDKIDLDIDDIERDMKKTYYDDRDDLLDNLDDLRSKLYAMEDYLTDEQHEKSEDLLDNIKRVEDTEYDGPTVHRDPYAERGLNRADFF